MHHSLEAGIEISQTLQTQEEIEMEMECKTFINDVIALPIIYSIRVSTSSPAEGLRWGT